MQIKTKSGRVLTLPTPAENAAINVGIAADPDTYEVSSTEFKQMRRAGRPVAAAPKERITIRLSPDVVERFRASGKGWQTRVDAALKEWLEDHSAA